MQQRMNSYTQKLLLSAWRENRLAVVHIDLQNMYIEGNEMVFRSVGDFAGQLRKHGLSNTWVTYPKIDDDLASIPMGLTTVGEFNRQAYYLGHGNESPISPLVQAHPFEKTIVKHWGSAFYEGRDSELYQHLDRKDADTVLIDGVAAYACISSTLYDGAILDRFNFIVVEDCINIPEGDDYKSALLCNAADPDSLERRFHSATSHSVLETLEQARVQTSSRKTALHTTRHAGLY